MPTLFADLEPNPDRPAFQPASDEEHKVLIFVNGSNETYAYSTSVAETLFKRLWWQGYKGRLVSFRWETLVGPLSGEIPAHYNLNEWLAWNWGKSLRDFVASENVPNGYSVNVAAHSLGCTVVGSALHLGMRAANIALFQGAIPAGCFDASDVINSYGPMLSREEERPTPDYAEKLGYRGFVTMQSSAVIYNFYNEKDYALAEGPLGAWEGNQRIYKPDGQEPLSGVSSGVAYFYLNQDTIPVLERGRVVFTPTGDLRHVSTAYESMAFIARSRSKAVGARKDVHGLIAQQVNIGPDTQTNLGDQRPDHSGLFTRSIQQLGAFYQTLNDIIK